MYANWLLSIVVFFRSFPQIEPYLSEQNNECQKDSRDNDDHPLLLPIKRKRQRAVVAQ